jgi:drug/metabolite transporter (DMT)-like permease
MAFTTIIWGAAFPITKPGLADMPPATFALLRFVTTAIILVPLVFIRRGGWHFSRRTWLKVAMAGLMGFTIIQLGQNWGLTLSTASDISILAATEPLSIALLAALFLGEKPNRMVWLGLFISLMGVWLVIGINPMTLFETGADGKSNTRILGDLLFLVGTLGWATYNIMSRHLTQHYDGLELTSGAVLCGLLGLAPFSLFELLNPGDHPIKLSGAVIGGVLYSALLVTVFGFLALSWSLKHVTAAKVALLFYLQPVSGVLISWLGGEQLSWTFGVGTLLILTGVYLAEQRGQVSLTSSPTPYE